MAFRISGLSPLHFQHLRELGDAELSAHGAHRIIVTAGSAMPDRIELRDAREGEAVFLVNYEHHAVDTPFRASHAIYVLEGAKAPLIVDDEIPPAMRSRLLSIRAFDAEGMMIDADIVEGSSANVLIERLFANAAAQYLHAHYARMGCYAALIERAA